MFSSIPPDIFGDSEIIITAVVLISLCIFGVALNSLSITVVLVSPKLR